jgi:hypothetical protein
VRPIRLPAKFSVLAFHEIIIPLLCTTSVKVKTLHGGADNILLWSLLHGPECFDLLISKFNF